MTDAPSFTIADDVAQLVGWFTIVDRLPAEPAAFGAKYGSFPDGADEVARFTRAVAEAQQRARVFGGPAALREALAQKPDVLTGTSPPDTLYARLVWLAGRIGNDADTVANTFDSLESLEGLDPAQRADAVKEILGGEGGVAATAATAAREIDAGRTALAASSDQIAAASSELAGTSVVALANETIGRVQATIPRLETKAQEQKAKINKWNPLDKTDWRAEYEATEREIAAMNADLALKQQLIEDVNGLFSYGNRVTPAILDIKLQLTAIQRSFLRLADQLNDILNLAARKQLGDTASLAKMLGLPAAVSTWRAVAASSHAFVQRSLVDPAQPSPADAATPSR